MTRVREPGDKESFDNCLDHTYELEKKYSISLNTNNRKVIYKAVIDELKEKGYFYLNSRSNQGKILALRFNLEEMSQGKVCLYQKAKTPILDDDKVNNTENSDLGDEQKSLIRSWRNLF